MYSYEFHKNLMGQRWLIEKIITDNLIVGKLKILIRYMNTVIYAKTNFAP